MLIADCIKIPAYIAQKKYQLFQLLILWHSILNNVFFSLLNVK